MTLAVTLAVTFHTSKTTQQNQNKPIMSDTNSDTDPYEHWLETGEYPDGAKRFQFVLRVDEIDGILEDEPQFGCYGYNELTPINAKRVRYAADAAMKAFMDYLTDNLDHS